MKGQKGGPESGALFIKGSDQDSDLYLEMGRIRIFLGHFIRIRALTDEVFLIHT